MRRNGRILLVLTISALSFPCQVAESETLSGTIVDQYGARVVGAKLLAKGEQGQYEVRTDSHGTYAVDLPSGRYELEVRNAGFCPARRPPMELVAGQSVTVNFTLFACAIANVIAVEEGSVFRERDEYVFPYKQRIIPLGRLAVMILYGEDAVDGSRVKYSGFRVDNSTYGVRIMYNACSIIADRAIFDSASLRMALEGHVQVHDGKTTLQADRAEARFISGSVIVNVQK